MFAAPDCGSNIRFVCWPKPDSYSVAISNTGEVRLKVPNKTKPQTFRTSGDPIIDIMRIKRLVKNKFTSFVTGKEPKARPKPMIGKAGKVHWLVKVGDPLLPEQPILKVGEVVFFNQPAYKTTFALSNTPLYYANFLLEDGKVTMPPLEGTPVAVAVKDKNDLLRFENFRPRPSLPKPK